MGFGIEKWVMVIMKCRKRKTPKEIELQNQESVRSLKRKKIRVRTGSKHNQTT